jgi:repressor LexA
VRKETNTAKNGTIVVALVDDQQVTLKYLQAKQNEVALIPANQRYQTKTFTPNRVKVQGELAMLIRNY